MHSGDSQKMNILFKLTHKNTVLANIRLLQNDILSLHFLIGMNLCEGTNCWIK